MNDADIQELSSALVRMCKDKKTIRSAAVLVDVVVDAQPQTLWVWAEANGTVDETDPEMIRGMSMAASSFHLHTQRALIQQLNAEINQRVLYLEELRRERKQIAAQVETLRTEAEARHKTREED